MHPLRPRPRPRPRLRLPFLHHLHHRRRPFSAPSSPLRDEASHAETLDYLQHIDSVALATTKRQVESIASDAQTLVAVTSQVLPKAATIQLNPSIPPYRTRVWAHHCSTFAPKVNTLLERVETLRLNLQDLEFLPYPLQNGETTSQKFRAHLDARTESDKLLEARNLKFQEEAHGRRLDTIFDTLEDTVQPWAKPRTAKRRRREAFKPVFRKLVAGTRVGPKQAKEGMMKNSQQMKTTSLAEAVKMNAKGWGKGALLRTGVGHVESRSVKPFAAVQRRVAANPPHSTLHAPSSAESDSRPSSAESSSNPSSAETNSRPSAAATNSNSSSAKTNAPTAPIETAAEANHEAAPLKPKNIVSSASSLFAVQAMLDKDLVK